MNTFDYRKYEITEKLLSEFSKLYAHYDNITAEDLMIKWWKTGRNFGLRLTDEGRDAFDLAGIEYHDVVYTHREILKRNTGPYGFILEISKKIKCPYYLGARRNSDWHLNGLALQQTELYIRLYDSRIAMLVMLHGSLSDYLSKTNSVS